MTPRMSWFCKRFDVIFYLNDPHQDRVTVKTCFKDAEALQVLFPALTARGRCYPDKRQLDDFFFLNCFFLPESFQDQQ